MRQDWLTQEELDATFGATGNNVLIDVTARFFNPGNIFIGSNVRIDANVQVVAGERIDIGNWIHIGAATHISSSGGPIVIDDFCGFSSRVNVFTSTDSYSDGYLSNSMVPDEFRKVYSAPVWLEKHALIGCGAVIMPGVKICFGASVGALSYVNKTIPPLMVVAGNPVRRVGMRNREKLEEFEQQVRRKYAA